MPEKIVYQAETKRVEILDPDGQAKASEVPKLTDDEIREMYKLMLKTRAVDDKALKMQRQGRMGTWASTLGQEAIQAAVGFLLKKEDWLAPAFREHGMMMGHGIEASQLMAYWKGDERGSQFDEEIRCLPVSIPIASQFVHAAGIGLALKLKGEKAVAIGVGGDGSTSEGDFHEALNFAAVFNSHTVFLIQNNHWAISVPREIQTSSQTLAQKAHAYGIEGIQVDGNDLFAVYKVVKYAMDKARAGKGPTLIEADTYRLGDHTTADEASRYRDPKEVEERRKKEPVIRLKKYMEEKGLWDDTQEAKLKEELDQYVAAEVEKLENMPKAHPREMFQSMYKDLPPHLLEQIKEIEEEVGE
jgi:pyruvate dehydrogenase E1 component alpha subunit